MTLVSKFLYADLTAPQAELVATDAAATTIARVINFHMMFLLVMFCLYDSTCILNCQFGNFVIASL